MILWLDTETFSEVPIKHGTYKYAENAEVMLFTWAFDDGPVGCIDFTAGEKLPADVVEAAHDAKVTIGCHNSMFDRTVMRLSNETALEIPRERWLDTMVQAYLHSLPGSLGTLGEIFQLGEGDIKDDEGHKLIRLFCMPRPKNAKLRRATSETHPKEWEQFKEYAKQDIVAMRKLYHTMPKWNLGGKELELWHLDQKINDRGMYVDTELAEAAVAAVAKRQAEIKIEVAESTDMAVMSPTKRDDFLAFVLEEYGLALADLKKTNIERLIEDPDIEEGLRLLLQLRLQATTTSTSKYKALLRGVNSDGYLRGTKQFAGAMRTGRWAGRVFQPDNLPRPTMGNADIELGIDALKAGCADLLFDNVMALASSAIRGSIIAPPGKVMPVADLSNIEGRAQAWLAGEEWKLQAFRDYDTLLVDVFGAPIPDGKGGFKRKGPDLYKLAYAKSFSVRPEDVTKDQRQVGKVQELALGYEGGAGAFATFALAYNIDLDELADLAWDTLDPALIAEVDKFADWLIKKKKRSLGMSRRAFIVCDSFKRLWREAHPAISGFWKTLDATIREAIANPMVTFDCGPLKIRRQGVWLRIQLPSGRSLCYPSIKVNDKGEITYKGVHQFTRKWTTIKSFGGKFFENVCQAFARDILAYNMPDIERAGFEIILTVHDEVVAYCDAGRHEPHEELAKLMATNKPWAEGLPLAAEGFTTQRYRK